MGKFKITGDMRMIANSAWISTTDEIKTKTRTDEDVERVVKFLAKHMHSSPFESVTLTYTSDNVLEEELSKSSFFKVNDSNTEFTTDLLNFSKAMHKTRFKTQAWKDFSKDHKELSDVVTLFDFNFEYNPYKDNLEDMFPQINVELVSVHDTGDKSTTRATWRVRCPLAISVQLLRHRSASFNMVSGRYKTIRQEIFDIPSDVISCSEKTKDMKYLFLEMHKTMDGLKSKYLNIMKNLKKEKDIKSITNPEYKRMREVARFILPEGRMTELYVSMYMDDFENFLKLRDSEHAQTEHIALAQLMKKSLKKE
jgi:flavin-dependent thymidylate synthase